MEEEKFIHLTSLQTFAKTMESNNKFLYHRHDNKMAQPNERIKLSLIRHEACSFWEEAVASTCYLKNQNYHQILGLITPYELWLGINMQDLKIFGFLAYVLILANKQSKLEQKARKQILIKYGDANDYKAYHLFDSTRNIVFYS